VAYSVIDTMMTGHASPADLAAVGLGASVYSSVLLALTGVVSALNPIVAHHYGARRWDAIGPSYVQGLWIALLLSLVGMTVLAFPGPELGLRAAFGRGGSPARPAPGHRRRPRPRASPPAD